MDFQINKTEGDVQITYGGWINDKLKEYLDERTNTD